MSDDDLTEPLIGEKSVRFAEDVSVRESDLLYPTGQRHYSVDDDKTISTSKNKSVNIGKTRFGISETAKILDPEELKKIQYDKEELIKKDVYRSKYGDDEFKNEYGEKEFSRLYGSECDDGKPCCGDKCIILGGKKTKRRRYTKKHRSRKSRRSKKSSKNNKKNNFI